MWILLFYLFAFAPEKWLYITLSIGWVYGCVNGEAWLYPSLYPSNNLFRFDRMWLLKHFHFDTSNKRPTRKYCQPIGSFVFQTEKARIKIKIACWRDWRQRPTGRHIHKKNVVFINFQSENVMTSNSEHFPNGEYHIIRMRERREA